MWLINEMCTEKSTSNKYQCIAKSDQNTQQCLENVAIV